jgi:hypothetical protein
LSEDVRFLQNTISGRQFESIKAELLPSPPLINRSQLLQRSESRSDEQWNPSEFDQSEEESDIRRRLSIILPTRYIPTTMLHKGIDYQHMMDDDERYLLKYLMARDTRTTSPDAYPVNTGDVSDVEEEDPIEMLSRYVRDQEGDLSNLSESEDDASDGYISILPNAAVSEQDPTEEPISQLPAVPRRDTLSSLQKRPSISVRRNSSGRLSSSGRPSGSLVDESEVKMTPFRKFGSTASVSSNLPKHEFERRSLKIDIEAMKQRRQTRESLVSNISIFEEDPNDMYQSIYRNSQILSPRQSTILDDQSDSMSSPAYLSAANIQYQNSVYNQSAPLAASPVTRTSQITARGLPRPTPVFVARKETVVDPNRCTFLGNCQCPNCR